MEQQKREKRESLMRNPPSRYIAEKKEDEC
jgi:hypothetical protein